MLSAFRQCSPGVLESECKRCRSSGRMHCAVCDGQFGGQFGTLFLLVSHTVCVYNVLSELDTTMSAHILLCNC